jgi:hypothetical protein
LQITAKTASPDVAEPAAAMAMAVIAAEPGLVDSLQITEKTRARPATLSAANRHVA